MVKKAYTLRAFGNYDVDVASDDAGISFKGDEGLTQQSFREECDINVIVKRFGLTGELPENLRMPVSGDFTGVSDFQTAMNLVVEAQAQFMTVPAEIRERFNHDPAKLIAFLENPNNKDEAIKLGLVNAPAEKTRDVVQAVDELAAKMVGGTPKP